MVKIKDMYRLVVSNSLHEIGNDVHDRTLKNREVLVNLPDILTDINHRQ